LALLVPASAQAPASSSAADSARMADLTQKVQALPEQNTSQKLKKAALRLALEQAANGLDVSQADYAEALINDVQTALPQNLGSAGISPAKLSFLRPLAQPDKNPYLESLYAWADSQLAQPDIPWKKCTPDFNVFTGISKNYGTRDEAMKTSTLIWLVAHPQSKYQGNPELFTRMMRRADAYIDAYDVHAAKYSDSINDFFALGPALYDFMATEQLWPDLILPSQRARWDKTIRKAADFWLGVYDENKDKGYSHMGKYTNRDLGMANILLNCGLCLKDQRCLDLAQSLIDAQELSIYPDGALAYIGTQNESCGYHDADMTLLTRYYLVTGNDKALDLLTRSQWYGPLSVEPKFVADYWTAPCWKHTWNGSYSTGTEAVAGLSGNPYLRSLLDLEIKTKGAKPDQVAAMFYRDDITSKPLPDKYTIYDRNLEGVRARYGNFSYAITTRVPGADEPGKDTLAGAMVLDDNPKEPYPLNAALMSAMPVVYLQPNSTKPQEMAYCTRDDVNSVITGKGYAAVSAQFALQTFGSSQRGKDVPWAVNQEWICVQDRMFGLLQVAPLQSNQPAAAVTAQLLFGTGGTAGGPPEQMQTVDDHHYNFGKLTLNVEDTNFPAIKVVSTLVRITKGAQIVFQDDPATETLPGGAMKTFSVDQPLYATFDLHPETVTTKAKAQRLTSPSGCLGLRVAIGNKLYVLWHNISDKSATLSLGDSILPNTTMSLHFSHEATKPVQSPAPARLDLEPHGQVLIVSSPDAADHEAGWENYSSMLGAQ
jgi:hypothetical protein